jgi:hypothetical protein
MATSPLGSCDASIINQVGGATKNTVLSGGVVQPCHFFVIATPLPVIANAVPVIATAGKQSFFFGSQHLKVFRHAPERHRKPYKDPLRARQALLEECFARPASTIGSQFVIATRIPVITSVAK